MSRKASQSKDEKAERLAEALRANLRRRKEQSRAMDAVEAGSAKHK